MRRRWRILAWVGPLVLVGIGLLLMLPLGWPASVAGAGVWVLMVGALGLWLVVCSFVKFWLERGTDTPARWRVLGALARTPVRAGLALLAYPLWVGWMIGFGRLAGARNGSLLVGVFENAAMALVASGMAFVAFSFVRRGDEPRCRACQYDLTGAPEGGYSKCPECGASLRFSPAIIRGSRHVIVPMIVVGVVFFGLGIASVFKLRPSVYVPHLPTGSLIEEATAPLGFSSLIWKELSSRQLSRGQTEALFEGLLEQRAAGEFSSQDAEEWLDAAVRTGSLPEALVERYYDGALTLWLAAPDVVLVKDILRFGVGGDYRGGTWTIDRKLGLLFLPEAVAINGEPVDPELVRFIGRSFSGQSLGTAQIQPYGSEVDRTIPSNAGPLVTVSMDAYAGMRSLELRVVGWIYFVDYSPGTYWDKREFSDAVWTKRVDLRKTVRIEH